MKLILRNLLTTMRRFKLASTLNILGLAVAFVSLTIILMEVNYAFSYNKCYKNYDNIYRLEVSSDSMTFNALTGRNWSDMLQAKFPQLDEVGLRMEYGSLGRYIIIERKGERIGFNEDAHLVSANMPEIFGFDMVEGNQDAFKEPGRIMIPQSMAERLWPSEKALGKPVLFESADSTLTIGGVYRDLPKNGMMRNVIYYSIHPSKRSGWDGWQFNYQTFVTLKNPNQKAELEQLIYNAVQTENNIPDWLKDYKVTRLQPITDTYFDKGIEFDSSDKGSMATIILLLSIGILILGIAVVNFVNFSTSLTPLRIKSINTQKVLGNPVSTIRMTLVAEAVGISLIAYLINIVILWALQDINVNSLLNANTSISSNTGIITIGIGVAIVTGILAGIYPAFYSTKLPPALALKGSFGMSPSGRRLRTALISFQFVISAILIIAATFMNLQDSFVRSADLGYKTEHTINVDLGFMLEDKTKNELFRNKMFENPQVKYIASSQFQFGSGGAQRMTIKQGDENQMFDFLPVTPEILKCFDINITDGRDFIMSDSQTPGFKLIFNESAAKQFGLKVGDNPVEGATVVGIMDNIHFKSLHHSNMNPLCFAVFNENTRIGQPYTYVKITGDPTSVVEQIRKCVAEIDPAYPVKIGFFDEVFNSLYESNTKLTTLITTFSLIAVLLSLMGVFGLVVFETQYRRKEIAVRRIMGATVSELLIMFNKRYVWIIGICFIVAAPIAYYGVTEWLKEFEYKTQIHWWVFALSFLTIAAITITTVTIQSWKTAHDNPARSLKTE